MLTGKDERLLVHLQDPLNAGTPLEILDAGRLTPASAFFVRCHGTIPSIDERDHRVTVDGLVERELELSVDDLRSRFPVIELEAALICAGNRRAGFAAVEPTPSPLQWNGDAIGNTVWSGTLLAAVLEAAGVRPGADHVAFEGAETVDIGDTRTRFGGSIPLSLAMDGGVLLAHGMDGGALPEEHGHPLRALVPGYVGARSVKWLSRITVQRGPSENHFQARDYRLHPPHVHDPADDTGAVPLGETPLDSAITHPRDGTRVPVGPLDVRGYALAGGDRTIERVEVSTDGGTTWVLAPLADVDADAGDPRWRWHRWALEVELPVGSHELAVRAWDSSGQTQPADAATIWNIGGYANNAWHRVRVVVTGRAGSQTTQGG